MFTDSVTDATLTTEHILRLTGLSPSTLYYYSIGYSGAAFFPSSLSMYFYTHPPEGSRDHYRFWVTGDAGKGDNNQRAVRDAFFYRNNGQKLDGWLWLGDNAYFYGYDSEYQANVFSNNTYENVMRNLVAWAAPGNHDYAQNPLHPNPPWLDIFDFPVNGEAGGLASGTEKYFSWNYGNIHFVQLDSYGSDRSDTGATAVWLKNDLAQNNSTWTIAYFHHPPYTKGNHNSDNASGADPELPEIRNGLVKVLEEYGVDLVLSGHSHAYERSRLMDEHYGFSATLHDSMYVDSTGGCYPGACAYKKDTIGGKGHKGAVYAVVGVSGWTSGTQSDWPHPIMHTALVELGSMLLDVHDNKLKGTFINATGVTRDSFTIVKNMKVKKVIQACKDSALVLRPTWHETALWWPPAVTADSLVVYPASDTLIVANDITSCLTDTFEIKIVPDSVCLQLIGVDEAEARSAFEIYPNPVGGVLYFSTTKEFSGVEIEIADLAGKIIYTGRKSPGEKGSVDTSSLENGIYFIRLKERSDRMIGARKFIKQE